MALALGGLLVLAAGLRLAALPAEFWLDEVWSWGTKVLGLEAGVDAGALAKRTGAHASASAADSGEPEPAGVV